MTGKSLDMRFALVPKLPFLPHQPASREEVWDYLKSTTEKEHKLRLAERALDRGAV
jgi:hypothetical protein